MAKQLINRVVLALTMAAAVVQTREELLITIVWPLDNNGVFHLTQIAATTLLYVGLISSYRDVRLLEAASLRADLR